MKRYISYPDIPIRTITVNGELQEVKNGNVDIAVTPEVEVPVKDVKVDGESVVNDDGVAEITIPEVPEVPIKGVTVNGQDKVDGVPVVNNGIANINIPEVKFPVEDVKVDGTSVVNNGVANVNIPKVDVPIKHIKIGNEEQTPVEGVVTLSIPQEFTGVDLKEVDGDKQCDVENKRVSIDLKPYVTKAELEAGVNFNELTANDLKINDKRVSLQGHRHNVWDIEWGNVPDKINLEDEVTYNVLIEDLARTVNELIDLLKQTKPEQTAPQS